MLSFNSDHRTGDQPAGISVLQIEIIQGYRRKEASLVSHRAEGNVVGVQRGQKLRLPRLPVLAESLQFLLNFSAKTVHGSANSRLRTPACGKWRPTARFLYHKVLSPLCRYPPSTKPLSSIFPSGLSGFCKPREEPSQPRTQLFPAEEKTSLPPSPRTAAADGRERRTEKPPDTCRQILQKSFLIFDFAANLTISAVAATETSMVFKRRYFLIKTTVKQVIADTSAAAARLRKCVAEHFISLKAVRIRK